MAIRRPVTRTEVILGNLLVAALVILSAIFLAVTL